MFRRTYFLDGLINSKEEVESFQISQKEKLF